MPKIPGIGCSLNRTIISNHTPKCFIPIKNSITLSEFERKEKHTLMKVNCIYLFKVPIHLCDWNSVIYKTCLSSLSSYLFGRLFSMRVRVWWFFYKRIPYIFVFSFIYPSFLSDYFWLRHSIFLMIALLANYCWPWKFCIQ